MMAEENNVSTKLPQAKAGSGQRAAEASSDACDSCSMSRFPLVQYQCDLHTLHTQLALLPERAMDTQDTHTPSRAGKKLS